MTNGSDVGKLRRELQLASIVDIQGSIHANDQKSSAGLVVHGLLFAGVLTVVANIDGIIDEATVWAQGAGVIALLIALGAFVVSIVELAKAAAPYQPAIADEISEDYKHVFFPLRDELSTAPDNPHAELLRKLAEVNSEERFVRVYAAEQVKLAEIREVQARRAEHGFRWLQVELYAVAAFLGLVVLVAVATPGLAESAALDRPALRWTIDHDGRQQLDGGGQLAIRQTDRAVTVMLLARGRGDMRVASLRGSVTLKCLRGSARSAATIILPLFASHRSGEGQDRLETTATIDVSERCRRIRSMRAQLVGQGQTTDGSLVRGKLTVQAR
jgi:hypothetical protein